MLIALVLLAVALTVSTVVEYDQMMNLEGRARSTTVSYQTVTVSSLSFETVTATIIMDVTPTQTCTDQTASPGVCNFHREGTLNIVGLPRFDYYDVTGLPSPSNFTFEGVRFNGTISNNYCPPNQECTGPTEACVFYTALTVNDNASYNFHACWYAYVAQDASISLYPENSPQVGFMVLPDGSVYVLVARAT